MGSRPSDSALADLLELVERAEEHWPHVTIERLRRLADNEPRWRALKPELARLVKHAIAAELVLADERTRITRTGRFVPVFLLRLNRRHPRAAALVARM